MQVACPQCRANLLLGAGDSHAGMRRLTCARCGSSFAVNVAGFPPSEAPTAPALPVIASGPAAVTAAPTASPRTSFQAEQVAGVIGAPPTSVHRVDTGTSVVVDPELRQEELGLLGQGAAEGQGGAGSGSWRRAAMEAVTQEIRVPESLSRTPTEQVPPPAAIPEPALATTPTETDPTLKRVPAVAGQPAPVEGLTALVTEPEADRNADDLSRAAGAFAADGSGVPAAVLLALGATAPSRLPGALAAELLDRPTAPDLSGITSVGTPPLLGSGSAPEGAGGERPPNTDPDFDLAAGVESDATAELRPEWRRVPPARRRRLGTAVLLGGVALAAAVLFLLARNNWVLDVARLGPLLSGAFGAEEAADPLRADLRLSAPSVELAALADRPRVLLVRGTVHNGSPVARAFIYVRAWVERGGVIVASGEAPLDNVFTVAELSRLTARGLRGAIVPAGRERRNLRLGPGEVVPFLVVLTSLPPGAPPTAPDLRLAISKIEAFEERNGPR